MRLPSFLRDRLLIAYAAGRLPSFAARRLREAFVADAELAAAYDALCQVERLAPSAAARTSASAPPAVTRAQRDRLRAAILSGTPASSDSVGAAHSGLALRIMAPLGFAVAAASLLLVVRDPAQLDEVRLVARGDAHEPLGVKASCLAADGARLIDSATVGAGRTVDRLDCPSGSLLAFAATNLGHTTRHLFIIGVTRAGERRWYEPFGPQADATAVAAGTVDEALSPVADTGGMPAEPVTLYVLIADHRVSASDVERNLSSALDRGVAIGRLDRLPLDVSVQARIELAP